jgi:hypothetical protein
MTGIAVMKYNHLYITSLSCSGLQAKGYEVGHYQARTLMRKAGVVCKQQRRDKVTTRREASAAGGRKYIKS